MDMEGILAAHRVRAQRRVDQAQSETLQKQSLDLAQPTQSASTSEVGNERKKDSTVPKIVLRFEKKEGLTPLSSKSPNSPATYNRLRASEQQTTGGLILKIKPAGYTSKKVSQPTDNQPKLETLDIGSAIQDLGPSPKSVADFLKTGTINSTLPKAKTDHQLMGNTISYTGTEVETQNPSSTFQTLPVEEGDGKAGEPTKVGSQLVMRTNAAPEHIQPSQHSSIEQPREIIEGAGQHSYSTHTVADFNRSSMSSRAEQSLPRTELQTMEASDNPYLEMLRLLPGTTRAAETSRSKDQIESLKVAPLFTRKVESIPLPITRQAAIHESLYTQYGLLGLCEPTADSPSLGTSLSDNLIFANMDAPWSAFICGSQGAGKSHTLSCLLENALLGDPTLGKLPNPLAGIVFHYDKFSSETTSQVCEAAFLCSSGVPVTVLVSPSNIWAMKRMYTNIPGLGKDSPRPKVLPLYLTEKQLNIGRILKLMAVDKSSKGGPLYMEVVTTILREMAMAGNPDGFSYTAFRHRLQQQEWLQGQSQALAMRISLLESFIAPSEATTSTRPKASEENIWAFPAGGLTIVDLSDPFVSEEDACAIFSTCLSIFLEARATCGRVVALDEAHKFLTQTGDAQVLTESLTSIIREQRHTGTRVFIATQEPTLSPKLIDLANVTIVHRFLSPAWYHILRDHLAGARKHNAGDKDDLFATIVSLETGQALLFCPTAVLDVEQASDGIIYAKSLGSGHVKIRVRSRLTTDGGKSIMASDKHEIASQAVDGEIKMHVVDKPPPPLFAKQSAHQTKSRALPVTISSESRASTGPNMAIPSHMAPTPLAVVAVEKDRLSMSSDPPSDETLRATACENTRSCFKKLGWQSVHNVSWVRALAMVEDQLGLERGYIFKHKKESLCIQASKTEMAKLRRQRGWVTE